MWLFSFLKMIAVPPFAAICCSPSEKMSWGYDGIYSVWRSVLCVVVRCCPGDKCSWSCSCHSQCGRLLLCYICIFITLSITSAVFIFSASSQILSLLLKPVNVTASLFCVPWTASSLKMSGSLPSAMAMISPSLIVSAASLKAVRSFSTHSLYQTRCLPCVA